MAELIREDDTLNQGRKKLNNAIRAFNETVVEGDSSVEAAQARVDKDGKTYGTLKERLDTEHGIVSAQLAEKASKKEVNALADDKADKGALAQVAQSKRDKDVEIEMNDLSQDVKEAMTGGSVAVVGEDAVGNINLKDNAVESRNIHKNARIKFPYFSDDSYDLNYFWDEKTVIASGDVKNNPFGTGCQVINFRSKTLESVGAVRLTQIAIVYGSGTNFDFGEGLYRHLTVNESTHELTRVSDWRKLGIDKVTNDLLDVDFMVSGYLEDDTFDLDYTVKEGNYFVNRNALNNPYRRSSVLKVSRYKLENTPVVRVVQGVMCTDIGFSGGKYAGRIATRTLNFNEETNEVLHKTDWTDGRDEVIEILLISNS